MPIRLRADVKARTYINAANYDSVEKARVAVVNAVRTALAGLGSDNWVEVDIELANR